MSEDRYILVIADNSPEMNIALEYACARSKKTGRKIIIATFIEPLDVLTTQGISEIMKNEAREEAEKILNTAATIDKLISKLNNENIPSVINTSWTKANIAPKLNCHSNLIHI